MRTFDFVAVLRHPWCTGRRLRGVARATRRILHRYYVLRARYAHDAEELWYGLERWAEHELAQPEPTENRHERAAYRVVLRRYLRWLTTYALRFPYEPIRRQRALAHELAEVRALHPLHG